MYKEKIIDVENNQEIYREYTAAEIAEVNKAQAEQKKIAEKLQEKEIARKAILEKLGLTDEEAKLLLS